MKALRGAPFLSLSSMTLVLVATALYQHRSTAALLAPANPYAQYQRYDEALQLLYTNRPVAAAELIASFPDEKLVITNSLLLEKSTTLAPAGLFLRIGSLLSRHAAAATHGGSRAQALLLRDTLAPSAPPGTGRARGGDSERTHPAPPGDSASGALVPAHHG